MKMKRSLLLRVLYFPCFSALMVTVFLLTFSVNVFAADTAAGSFPYKKSQILTYNSFMSNELIDKFRSVNLPIDDPNYVLMYSDHSPFTQYPQYNNQYDVSYYFFLLPIEDFDTVYDGFNFYNNNLNVNLFSNSNYYYISVICDYTSDFQLLAIRTPSYATYSSSLYQSGMFGHIPSIDSVSGFIFTPFTPAYFNQDFYSSNDVLVLDYFETSTVPDFYGHATGPINDPDNFVNDLNGHRITKPTFPTINNYSWTTYNNPPIDTSTAESLLESIWNSLVYNFSYLFTNLGGLFNNLINNIEDFVNYIADSIFYISNNIVSAIQNFATDFYNNMVSLFEPMFETLGKVGLVFSTIVALGTDPETGFFSIPYLTETLFMPDFEDMAEIMEVNDSLHIINNVDRIVDKVWLAETSIIKTLHNVTPAKKFHIPSCYFHGQQIGDFDIDFSWFEPYKTYTDVIIGTFLVIGWIYWFFVSCSHILRYGKTYDYDEHEIGGGVGIGVRF